MWLGKVAAYAIRMRQSRTHTIATVAATSLSQRHWYKRLVLQSGALHVIYRWYIATLRARGWRSIAEIKQLNDTATKLQAVYRGHLGRIYALNYRVELETAAKTVQRGWSSKIRRVRWRQMLAEARRKKRKLEEDSRASYISRQITNRNVFEVEVKHHAAAAKIQRIFYRNRTEGKYEKMTFAIASKNIATGKSRLEIIEKSALESVVFQAEVWKECLKSKSNAPPKNLESEFQTRLDELHESCITEYSKYCTLLSRTRIMEERTANYLKVKKQMNKQIAEYQRCSQPYATQSKELAKKTGVMTKENKRLQREVIRVKKLLETFHQDLSNEFAYDPLIYGQDLDKVLRKLDGHWNHNSNQLYPPVWQSLVKAYGPQFDPEK